MANQQFLEWMLPLFIIFNATPAMASKLVLERRHPFISDNQFVQQPPVYLDRRLVEWTGAVTAASQQLEDGSYYNLHHFEGVEGEAIMIELTSEAFDAYLILQGPSGVTIAENDGEGKNSRLVLTLPESGAYTILANTNAAGETGSYQLAVRAATQQEQLARADMLDQQVIELNQSGLYREAISLAEESLALRQRLLGESHPDVALSLNNLAFLYKAQGRYEEAELLFEESLVLWRRLLGDSHPDVAVNLNNLASLYQDQGRYAEAEPLFEESLALRRRLRGDSHPSVATGLNNLALIYHAQGRYEEAEPLFEESLALRRLLLGDSHPEVAVSLNNLASVYQDQDRYEEAEPLFEEALALLRRLLGDSHPNVATSLNNLASFYYVQGRYEEAEPLFEEALALWQQLLGDSHPNVAVSLNNLASLYRDQGRYEEAEPLFEEALALRRRLLGDSHPNVALSLNNLAVFYWRQGRLEQALNTFQSGLRVEERVLTRNLIGGSEREKQIYLTSFRRSRDMILSFHLQHLTQTPEVAQEALTIALQRKGRLLDLFANAQQILRNQLDPNSQALLDQRDLVQDELSTLAFNRPKTLSLEEYRQGLSDLENQYDQLQEELSRRSAQFRVTTQSIDLATVQSLLPTDGVLIEFVRYQVYDPKANPNDRLKDFRYAAYLLKSTGEIQGIDLGDADDIDALIADLSIALRNPNIRESQVQTAAQKLESVVLAPLREELAEVKHLLISPDGVLNLIPFEALVSESGRYLVQDFEISYLTSGRDLLRLSVESAAEQPPLLLADPNFGEQANWSTSGSQLSDLRQRRLSPLIETAAEVSAIASQLSQTQWWKGTQAIESIIKKANRPSILHIATHGFFFRADGSESIPTENSLLRSGLLLAGFRNSQSGEINGVVQDGVLTALEVSGLDLFGTELVVFSACDTGLGDWSVGEGVYGLRRALVLAGAESQVMSLWQVRDDSTKDLMVAYYGRLMQGEGRSAALRSVQLAMLDDEKTAHPYYWAPFINSGSWEPISLSQVR